MTEEYVSIKEAVNDIKTSVQQLRNNPGPVVNRLTKVEKAIYIGLKRTRDTPV